MFFFSIKYSSLTTCCKILKFSTYVYLWSRGFGRSRRELLGASVLFALEGATASG